MRVADGWLGVSPGGRGIAGFRLFCPMRSPCCPWSWLGGLCSPFSCPWAPYCPWRLTGDGRGPWAGRCPCAPPKDPWSCPFSCSWSCPWSCPWSWPSIGRCRSFTTVAGASSTPTSGGIDGAAWHQPISTADVNCATTGTNWHMETLGDSIVTWQEQGTLPELQLWSAWWPPPDLSTRFNVWSFLSQVRDWRAALPTWLIYFRSDSRPIQKHHQP